MFKFLNKHVIKGRTSHLIIGLLVTSFISGCGYLFFKDVGCRPLKLTSELYWGNQGTGESIVFKDSLNNQGVFVVTDKWISRARSYTSDTGCECNDRSRLVMAAGNDTIWMVNELFYVNNNRPEYIETISITLNGSESLFWEKHATAIGNHLIEGDIIQDVKRYDYDYTGPDFVKHLYLAKKTGA